MLKDNQMTYNGQLVQDLEELGVGVTFLRSAARGGASVQTKGPRYNKSAQGKMSLLEFKQQQKRDVRINQARMMERTNSFRKTQ
jgi:hypothetical protein